MRDKEKALREGVERLLSERTDPSRIDRIVKAMTGTDVQNRSVPDRLLNLSSLIKNLREETEDLSGLLEYHSGSRLSQVIDLLNQAQVLTEETIRQTTGVRID